MPKLSLPFLALLSLGLFSGCATTPIPAPPPVPEAAKQAVYATNDSLHKRRVDLAIRYSDQSVRLIAPPVHRIIVKPIYSSSPSAEEIYQKRLNEAEAGVVESLKQYPSPTP